MFAAQQQQTKLIRIIEFRQMDLSFRLMTKSSELRFFHGMKNEGPG